MRSDESFINQQGAHVFYDYRKHAVLDIPKLNDTSSDGVIYKVLTVGFFGFLEKPHITINQGGQATLYLLPDAYIGWVMHCLSVAQQGSNFFPEDVEFGYLINDDRYYAHIY